MTTFRVLGRDFITPLTIPDLNFRVERYSQAAQFGPDKALVRATGPVYALWEMAEWLGCPVEIYDDQFRLAWWGRLDEMTISIGKIRVGLRLQDVANRVVVAYSYVEPGSTGYGTRATTAWGQDDESVTMYGKKERQITLSSATLAQAEMTRDAVLEALHLPVPSIDIDDGGAASGAEFVCGGWLQSLGNIYYAQSAGKESYEISGQSVPLGRDGAVQRVAMSFQITSAAGWSAAMIKVRGRKVGAPTDNLVVELCANAAGAPGTVLTADSLPAASISANTDWIAHILEYLLAGGFVNIAPSTTYWVVFSRSGGLSATNYYELVTGASAYPRGVMRVWTGASWAAYDGSAALNFQVLGGKETTEQISDIVVTAGAGILSGVFIENRSNVISNQYRRGDNTALFELLELLKSGTSNGRRLLSTISPGRELVVWEEPERSLNNVRIYLTSDGRVLDLWDNPVMIQSCPVGVWALLRNGLPSSLDLNRMADPSLFFVEQAEYDVNQKRYLPRPRGAQTVWDITTSIMEG